MECCPPAAYQYPPDDDTSGAADDDDDAGVASDADAQVEAAGNAEVDEAVGETAAGTDEEKGEEPKEADLCLQPTLPPQLPWIDVSSVSRCIDYSDFLDMLCRVVFSDWWTYSPASSSSSHELQLEGKSSEQLSPPLLDSSQNIMAKEELFYSRLLTFSLTFNVDELTSSKI
jgi:hypothetical protein